MAQNDSNRHGFNGNIMDYNQQNGHFGNQKPFSRRQQYLEEKLLCHKLRTFVILKAVLGVVAIIAIVPIIIGTILLLT
jgi:hypothetical protein